MVGFGSAGKEGMGSKKDGKKVGRGLAGETIRPASWSASASSVRRSPE